jgi:O-methyltransferase
LSTNSILALNATLQKKELVLQDMLNIKKFDSYIDVIHEIHENGTNQILYQKNEDGTLTEQLWTRNLTELSHTMIGKKRLDNIQYCVESILEDDIPGDFIETGIWRGGAVIFMRGLLEVYGITDRVVWAADSFDGVPPPTFIEDAGFNISKSVFPVLAVSLEEVLDLFERYDLLDEQVNFIQGWFKDTLTEAPIKSLAVLRLDGDLYESTMDALNPLYHKVSAGGFIIVDDYNSCEPCKRAVDEFRTKHAIQDKLITIDQQSVYWRKSSY